jgi:hypothetical protein
MFSAAGEGGRDVAEYLLCYIEFSSAFPTVLWQGNFRVLFACSEC